ncbi:hypothetical protein SBRCBS47491_008168 [Sporothrix bragantina]|uniref:Cardiolipin synthase n=1 Tax=Sporothrix bragantina TaxID=671064 RepID=A0ABP0CJW0_9PEZI
MLRLTTTGCGRAGRRAASAFSASSTSSLSSSASSPATSVSTALPLVPACQWGQSPTQQQTVQRARLLWTSSSAKPPAASLRAQSSSSATTTSTLAQAPAARCRLLFPALLSGVLRRQQQQPQHVRLLSNESQSSSSPPPATTATRHENIYTVPNFLTVARLIASPFVGYLIVADQPGWALSLLAAAAVTDLLDGWIARRWNLHTVVGSVLDPMADKVLMTVLAVSLAAQGGLPMWLAVLVLGRDVGLAIAAIYYRWVSLPPPKTFTRYWDFSLPSAEVRPTTISKYNTFLQLALMGATTAAPVLAMSGGTAAALLGGPYDLYPALTVMQYVVAVTTVWSGASYVFSKDAVKILTQKNKTP